MKESYKRRNLKGEKFINTNFGHEQRHMHKVEEQSLTRVISITSGKGGVGKTTTVINIALALTRMGKRVLVFDADLSLANIHVLLGINPESDLQHVLSGDKQLSDILIEGPEGIQIIPSASGVQSMCRLTADQKIFLLNGIEEIASSFDYLLIDTQAGISEEVMYFNSASAEVVCVINDEPTSLTDAYALIKVLSRHYGEKEISIIVNDVPDVRSAQRSFERLAKATEQFLQVQLDYKGFIPTDPAVSNAVCEQRAVLEVYPSSPAARSFMRVADHIDQEFYNHRIKGGMQFFFRQLMEVSAYGS